MIGTNRHESRRIDNQLRGRAGRQGDPGLLAFLYFAGRPVDGEVWRPRHPVPQRPRLHTDAWSRASTWINASSCTRYDVPVEGQRHKIHSYRQAVLDGRVACQSELERQITLRVVDDLWADYLARLEDFRAGIPWQSFAGVPGFFVAPDRRDPHFTFLRQIDEWFPELEAAIPDEIARRLAEARGRRRRQLWATAARCGHILRPTSLLAYGPKGS